MSLNASTAGLRALRLILSLPPQEAGAIMGKIQPFMTYPEDAKAFDYVRQHFAKHGKLPHPDTLLDQIQVFLPESAETLDFELEQLQARYIEDEMRAASDTASGLLAEGKAKDALTSMISKLLPVTQGHGGYSLTDLRDTQTLHTYQLALDGKLKPGETLGYPSLDEQGGIEDGDMIGIIGKPGSGKTWLMLKTALHHWGDDSIDQHPHMFVTQEMSAAQIEKRILPLVAGVDPTPLYKGHAVQYEIGGLTPQEYLQRLEAAREAIANRPIPFLIYDSKMAGTVADIEAIASMHGVKRVWIDGAYMLRHPDPRLGRYARVPENLDLMKQWQQRTGVSTVSSWQFKRGAGKEQEDGEVPDLDDIGYSHAIPEYMGVILGLLENPKAVKEQGKKKVTIMKGRNGESGEFMVHWDFANCNFDEWSPAAMDAAGISYI
jgi:replicative DNA helicase